MNIKIDNMVDLRAFCLELAVQRQEFPHRSTIRVAKEYEDYILSDAKLPDQPFNSDKLLYDTMTEMIKNKEIQENEIV